MHCEAANAQLVEFASGEIADNERTLIETHLNDCATCQEDYAAISAWHNMAQNWHDEVAPAWQIPQLDRPSYVQQFADSFRQWFPTFASATALVLVTVMYTQNPEQTQGGFVTGQQVTDYRALPELPQATQAAFTNAFESNREQRQQELQSLLEILTAEMNRRSIETEDSMRFLVTSQIQDQKELDQLYQQLEKLVSEPDSAQPQLNRLFEGESP